VTFGVFAGCFGFLACLFFLSLTLAPDPFSPHLRIAIATAFYNLATAIVSGYSVVRRLDGRPTARWAVASLGMVSAFIMQCWPLCLFPGW